MITTTASSDSQFASPHRPARWPAEEPRREVAARTGPGSRPSSIPAARRGRLLVQRPAAARCITAAEPSGGEPQTSPPRTRASHPSASANAPSAASAPPPVLPPVGPRVGAEEADVLADPVQRGQRLPHPAVGDVPLAVEGERVDPRRSRMGRDSMRVSEIPRTANSRSTSSSAPVRSATTTTSEVLSLPVGAGSGPARLDQHEAGDRAGGGRRCPSASGTSP